MSDVLGVIDYLKQLEFIDLNKIGIVGICAGGGYTIAAAKADYRLKAVATISMVNIGDSVRLGWDGDGDLSRHVETLKQAAEELRAQHDGSEPVSMPYVPPKPDDKTPNDLCEAHDYYLTSRAQHPRAANKRLLRSLPMVLNFDAFHLANLYLKQPTLLIAGGRAGSKWHTEKLDKILGGVAKKVIVPEGHTWISMTEVVSLA